MSDAGEALSIAEVQDMVRSARARALEAMLDAELRSRRRAEMGYEARANPEDTVAVAYAQAFDHLEAVLRIRAEMVRSRLYRPDDVNGETP